MVQLIIWLKKISRNLHSAPLRDKNNSIITEKSSAKHSAVSWFKVNGTLTYSAYTEMLVEIASPAFCSKQDFYQNQIRSAKGFSAAALKT